MRRLVVMSAALIALAACGQQSPTPEAETGGGLADAFPNVLQASYRAEANVRGPDGATIPVVMIRSGNKLRMEMTTPQGAQTIIVNPDANESYVIAEARGMRMAMRTDASQVPDASQAWSGDLAANATRTGTCSVAGESGSEWSRQEADGTNTACVTNDGIILRATQNGETTWETTSVSRGAQDASLFTLPPGVQTMDVNSMAAQAMEQMKAQMGQQ